MQFSELPPELMIAILSFADALSILRLRQCSKIFYNISQERTVWVNALRTCCLEHQALFSAFPTSSMSLVQLEHCALAQLRFLRRLQTSLQSGDLDDFAKHIVPVARVRTVGRRLDPDVGAAPFKVGFLVPGGRFLFTLNAEDELSVWDLGFSADMDIQDRPIATVRIGGLDWCLHALLTEDGQRLQVMTVSEDSAGAISIYIHEIDPCVPSPSFTLKARHVTSIPADSFASFTQTSRFVASSCTDELFLLWDFKVDSYLQWRGTVGATPIDIVIVGDSLLVLYKEALIVYKISLLTTGTNPEPVHRIMFPAPVTVTVPTGSNRPYFDVIRCPDGGFTGAIITRYFIPEFGPPAVFSETIAKEFDLGDQEVEMSDLAEDFRLATSFYFTGLVFAHLSKVGTDSMQQYVGALYLPRDEMSISGCWQCPMTGRLCVLDEDSQTFEVLDYVEPPPK